MTLLQLVAPFINCPMGRTADRRALTAANLPKAARYVLADNKLAVNAGWDPDLLAIELQALLDVHFDVSAMGFSMAEVDLARRA